MKNSKKLTYSATILLALTLVIGELGRIPLGNNIYLRCSDIAVAIFLLINLNIQAIRSNKVQKTIAITILIVFVIMLLSDIMRVGTIPPRSLLSGILYPVRWFMYSLLPLAVIELYHKDQNNNATWIVSQSIVAVAVLGLIQLVLIPNLAFLEPLGYDPHYLRLVSTWLDPNFLGAALVMGIASLLLVQKKETKFVSTIEAAVLFIALIATFSRSTYLMLAITFILYYVLRRNWKGLLLLTLGGILIASIYFIPRAHIDKAKRIDRELSANLRLLSYMHAVTLFNDHPVLGVGYDLIRYEKNARYMVYDLKEGGHSGAGFESSWLTILATTGVIGTLVYAAYWLTTLFTIIEPAKASAQNLLKNTHAFILKGTVQEHLVASLLVGWFAHAWFVNSLLYPYLLIIWAIIVGTVLAKK